MNIFFLDRDQKKAALYHCDKHCVKMILEYAQLLSTAHRVIDGKQEIKKINNRNYKRYILNDSREDILYQSTHVNHPSAIWSRQSIENYFWLYKLFVELNEEYTHRYNKTHLSYVKLNSTLSKHPMNMPKEKFVEMSKQFQAIPIEYKDDCPVVAYRKYYIKAKKDIATWKTTIPDWYENNLTF